MHAHVLREDFATSHPTQHRTLVGIYVARKSHLAAVLQQQGKKPPTNQEREQTLYNFFLQWGYNTTLAESELQVKGNFLDLTILNTPL